MYNEKGFINPIDIDKVLPGYPYDSALTLLRCNVSVSICRMAH